MDKEPVCWESAVDKDFFARLGTDITDPKTRHWFVMTGFGDRCRHCDKKMPLTGWKDEVEALQERCPVL